MKAPQDLVFNHRPMPLFSSVGLVPPPPPKTRYQGSKYKLLEWIWQHISNLDFDTVLDAFGGSACVSHFLKARGKVVTYNDMLRSNYLIGQAIIANDSDTVSNSEVSFLTSRHKERMYSHFIEETFQDIYFTEDENIWLDTVAQNIPNLRNQNKEAIAYYALFQSAISKRPYNLFHRRNLYMRTSEVTRSFGNKATWDKPFDEHFRRFVQEANASVFSNGCSCQALNMDALAVPGEYDLVYIDTPYINRKGIGVDYYGFYHFLEGLADYECWGQKIDCGSKHKRLLPVKSVWTNPKEIHKAFRDLFKRFRNSNLVVSYRSDGIPTSEELVEIMAEYKPTVSIYRFHGNYKYVLSTNHKSTELLIIGRD